MPAADIIGFHNLDNIDGCHPDMSSGGMDAKHVLAVLVFISVVCISSQGEAIPAVKPLGKNSVGGQANFKLYPALLHDVDSFCPAVFRNTRCFN